MRARRRCLAVLLLLAAAPGTASLAMPGRLAPHLGLTVPGAWSLRGAIRPLCVLPRAPRLGLAVPGAFRMRGALRPVCALPRGPLPPHLIEMQEELDAGEAQLFDVREPGEFAAGSLAQATLVPLSELQEGVCPADYDKAVVTYVHCAAGVRVRYAKPMLE
jgi:hypothetical protein